MKLSRPASNLSMSLTLMSSTNPRTPVKMEMIEVVNEAEALKG